MRYPSRNCELPRGPEIPLPKSCLHALIQVDIAPLVKLHVEGPLSGPEAYEFNLEYQVLIR